MSDTLSGVTTGSFQRVQWPSDVRDQILNLLIGGSPFANSLTRLPTDRASVAFPAASPDRPAWTPEMGEIPVIGLGDSAYIVGVAKLASIVLLSNESIADTSINLVSQLGDLLRDSASAELDRGLLYGEGAPEPVGVVAAASAAAGPDLAEALTAAIGSVGDNGGTVSHLAARPSVLAQARNTRSADGTLLYPSGLGAAFGVTEVGVPELQPSDILAYDASRVDLIVRKDFVVDVSSDWAFREDAGAVRLTGRFAVACPSVDKALRKLDIGAPAGGEEGASEATTTTTTRTRRAGANK